MSAIEETTRTAGTAGVSGKSIHDGSQLSVDDATRATLPQLRYADAVHTALAGLDMAPDLLETGMRREGNGSGQRELFLRAVWLPGHEALGPEVAGTGVTVEWSHLAGWTARAGDDLVVLPVDELAAPDVIAETALHAALCGIGCDFTPPSDAARWEHAVYLDIALTAYDERLSGVTG